MQSLLTLYVSQRAQADALEFHEWQQRMAEQRNQGQFFKSLYRADTTPIVGEDVSQIKVCSCTYD